MPMLSERKWFKISGKYILKKLGNNEHSRQSISDYKLSQV